MHVYTDTTQRDFITVGYYIMLRDLEVSWLHVTLIGELQYANAITSLLAVRMAS